jgi:MFS family permease
MWKGMGGAWGGRWNIRLTPKLYGGRHARVHPDAMREETEDATTETAQLVPAESPPEPGPATQPTGYTRVFAVAEFRALFAAHALSLLGVVVSEIALTVLVYKLTGSPLLSALVFALGFLPYLVGGTLLAGVADRFPARRVLVVCDLVCAGCAAGMAVPVTPVAALLALRCVIAVVSPVFSGTRTATLVDVLGEGDLFVLGRSLLRIVSQSALLVGFGLGGVLLTVVPPRGALVITVCTFLGSALLLRFGTRRRPARAGGGSLVRSSLTGARQVLSDRRIRALLLLLWAPPVFVVAPEALAAAYADEIGAGPAGVGLLMCAMPIGTIAGEVYAGSVLTPAARSRILRTAAAAGLPGGPRPRLDPARAAGHRAHGGVHAGARPLVRGRRAGGTARPGDDRAHRRADDGPGRGHGAGGSGCRVRVGRGRGRRGRGARHGVLRAAGPSGPADEDGDRWARRG